MAFKSFYGSRSGSKWLVFDPTLEEVPPFAGVYAIYLDGVLTYIGQSLNVAARLRWHGIEARRYSNAISCRFGEAASTYVKVRFGHKFGDWAMRELRLIERLQPPGNRRGISKAGKGVICPAI